MKRVDGKKVLWGIDAAVSFFACPLGLVLTALLAARERKSRRPGQTPMLLPGMMLAAAGLFEAILTALLAHGQPAALWVAGWFFGGALIGLWMTLLALGYKAADRRHSLLHTAILQSHRTDAQTLAAAMGRPYAGVRRDLANMVRWGVLPGAVYDRETGSIAMPDSHWMQSVICPGCGAQLTVDKVLTPVCPYCGTAL